MTKRIIQQSDRDAAAGYYRTQRGKRILSANIKEGYVDDDPLVQELAAYRELLTGFAA